MLARAKRPKRTQISEWDWHYRVGFDSNLAQAVRDTFGQINNGLDSHKELQELEHYQSIISLDCLVSSALQSPSSAEIFLDTSKNKHFLFLPDYLATRLNSAITTTNKLSDKIKKGFEELIHAAVKQEFVNHAAALVETALGKGFLEQAAHHLKQTQGNLDRPRDESIDICKTEVSTLLKLYQDTIIDHGRSFFPPELQINPVFQTQASQNLACFAEYWPHLITGEPNALILSDTLQRESLPDIIGTFVHEIGGHACFYDLASKDTCRFIDHGAICLIEGWATWIEWHSPFANLCYRKKLHSDALFSIAISSATDACKIESKIKALYNSKANKEVMLPQSLLNFYQYPGFSLSYHAGAAWFDMRLKNDSSATFWRKNCQSPLTNILSSLS